MWKKKDCMMTKLSGGFRFTANFKRGIWEAGTVASDVQIHSRVPGKSACDGSFLDARCSSPLTSVPQ